jgi:hypothetical protein
VDLVVDVLHDVEHPGGDAAAGRGGKRAGVGDALVELVLLGGAERVVEHERRIRGGRSRAARDGIAGRPERVGVLLSRAHRHQARRGDLDGDGAGDRAALADQRPAPLIPAGEVERWDARRRSGSAPAPCSSLPVRFWVFVSLCSS